MSTARHHAEWLSLLEISGPFLSLPVLLRAFPQGLDAHAPEAARLLRLAHAEWQEEPEDASLHTAWVRFVLERTLELPDTVIAEGQAIPASLKAVIAEHAETLRPDLAIVDPNTPGKARLLVQTYPADQDLEKPLRDRRWKASPATRMMMLLHACDVRLGLVTNGERWMLVDAPRDGTTGYISWYASLWLEEPVTLRAFRSLLGCPRFFNVPEADTLVQLLIASVNEQQEVTEQLGNQVRRAVEVLVQALDRADQDRNHTLLAGITETQLYEAALTVMMRLVVLFSAEERGLLLLGDPLYDQNYAVSTLRAQLREAADQHGEEVLERRFDAWPRLLATFHAVYAGAWHQDLKLPAYGGSLFDPDRFPFLEGRAKEEGTVRGKKVEGKTRLTSSSNLLPINNRVMLHILESLQILQVKVPGGGPAEARRLSFRALDIEQIGHVYEGLLDHTAVRSPKPVLGLAGTKGKEPEVSLAELEKLAGQATKTTAKGKGHKAQKPEAGPAGSPEALIDYLREQTGRSEPALRRGLAEDVSADPHRAARFRVACGNDDALYQHILAFAGLVRDDDFGYPVVILPGSVYVTAGTDRRSSGTHYTPRLFTEPIVARTLEPLIYIGPAEGLPKEQWRLRRAAELLALKICDMAMGSGAFLVQTCRYLAERLVEAWEMAEEGVRGQGVGANPQSPTGSPRLRITPEGILSTGAPGEQLIPDDADERLLFARRIVADRCLYGVDKNPLAVEMAKLSLWLITLAKDRPFTFLDHALKCGDSLVGADEAMFERWAHGLKSSTATLFDEQLRNELGTARAKRKELESFEVRDVRDAERKAALLAEADAAMARVQLGCDLLIGVRLQDLKPKEKETALSSLLLEYMAKERPDSKAAQEALQAARAVRAFHWPFEFPEVFEHGGFSAFVGNPPFVGGKRISTNDGNDYLDYLKTKWAHTRGSADLCAYFFLRAFENLRPGGAFGLIATNTIAQGDTREVGLDFLAQNGGTFYAAVPSQAWPGAAAVYVSVVHVFKGAFAGVKWLDGKSVTSISAFLDDGQALGNPKVLNANVSKSHIGSLVLGMGFVLEPTEAQTLIEKDPKNREVLFPYLNGEDLNSRSDQSPSRWVIDFFDWPLEKARHYSDVFQIIQREVWPERKPKPGNYSKLWWQYGRRQERLYEVIAPLERVLVVALTSKTGAVAFMPTNIVFSHATGVFAFDDDASFAILQSSFHFMWAWKYGSSLKGDLRYTPTDCFETFPFPRPPNSQPLATLGEHYHAHRRQTMLARQEGLTKTYNRLGNWKKSSIRNQGCRRDFYKPLFQSG